LLQARKNEDDKAAVQLTGEFFESSVQTNDGMDAVRLQGLDGREQP